MKRLAKVAFRAFLAVIVLALVLPSIEVAATILFGWLAFPFRAVPEMTFEPAALAVGAGCLAWFAVFVHLLSRWLYREKVAKPYGYPPALRWRFAWSAAIVGLVVFLFVAGIALIGIVHE